LAVGAGSTIAAGVAADKLAGMASSALLGGAASGILGTAVSTAIGGVSSAAVGMATGVAGGKIGDAIAGPVGGMLGGAAGAAMPSVSDVAARSLSAAAGKVAPGVLGKAMSAAAGFGVTAAASALRGAPVVKPPLPVPGDVPLPVAMPAIPSPLEGALFEFVAPSLRRDLQVVSFTGREWLSELFRFEIVLATRWAEEALHQEMEEALLGQPACLSIHSEAGPRRVIHGLVASFRLEASAPEIGRPCVRVELVPKLWLATQKKRTRIFQDTTIREVVDAVLSEWRVPRSWRVREEWAPRTYCTQYDETDYEFIRRLLAEEGVFFFFGPPAGSGTSGAEGLTEELVLCDHERAYSPIASETSISLVDPGQRAPTRPKLYVRTGEHAAADEGQAILEFGLHRAVRPNAALLSGYDSRVPLCRQRAGAGLVDPEDEGAATRRRDLFTPVRLRRGELEFHLHHPRADYESTPAKAQIEAPQAKKALDQLRRDAYVGVGESRVWRLAPGHAFRLAGHPLDRLDHEYAVTEVEHVGRSTLARNGKAGYRNRFRCVPAEAPCRPPVPPRRMVQVAETATVVGAGGEEVFTDSQGRIRVRFHWDLEESPEARSSCWIRVAQPWAGVGWGHQFIPRVGSEVLVLFLRGDPDAPLVIGSAYNGEHPPAFLLPESKTRSGIRTSSSPGGLGYNELSFEDEAGMEEILLRAERNLAEEVTHDHVVHVGHDEIETVDGVRTAIVKGAQRETVMGLSATTVLLGRTDVVVGPRQVASLGDKLETVAGSDSRTLEQDQSLNVKGARTVKVDGALLEQVGTEEKPTEMLVSVLGRQSTSATRCLTLQSGEQIVLECGESRLCIGPEEVRIEAKRIVMSGEESSRIEGNGPALELTSQAQLTGQVVNLYSQAASLELTSVANLNGAQVNLNCGGGGPGAGADGEAPKLKPLTMKLHDEEMVPFASKHYRLMVGGFKYEGTTDGEGGFSEQVPEDAKVGQLTVWVEEYPTGSTLDWAIALPDATVSPANDLPGALHRLHALGYYEGEAMDTLTPEAEAALRWFQQDYELPATGELDAATAGKLAEIQGT
jgi:type VI secretion system secreted protein VgrG